ncbi:MAG: hypothetical protein IJ865_09115 [Clostridia bacterium]|nr:hypothetical protein [Clostridia bacterium]
MKKLLALVLGASLAVSCVSFATAEEALPTVHVESTLFGTADTEGFSTLKAFTDKELTVPGKPVTYTGEAVIQVAFEDGTPVDDAKIDLTDAKVAITDGDAYYAEDFILNAASLEGEMKDGQIVYTLQSGDVEWNQYGYPVAEGGLEWSAIGGNGNGEYALNFEVSGIKYEGQALAPATFRTLYSIYGREFTAKASPRNPAGSVWGAGGYDNIVIPEAAKAELTETVPVENAPVFTWVGAGDLPVLCDDQTDNFYITWPEGVDASHLTDADVTLTLKSAYGDERVLVPNTGLTTFEQNGLSIPNGEYTVYADAHTTQISVNLQLWAAAPVYTKLSIQVGGEISAEATFDVASVYTHMVQTGGGLDLQGKTVTVVCLYGIDGIENLTVSDVFQDVTYRYTYREGQGPQAKELYFLVDDGNGGFTVTENKEDATVYPSEASNVQLLGHNIFTTDASGSVEVEFGGETYTFTKAMSYGNAAGSGLKNPAQAALKAAPGYVLTQKGSYDDHQRWGWLHFNGVGWLAPAEETK